jgi:hypothetical protein
VVTPALDLSLGFVMTDAHRHVRTNEPGATRGPTFLLVRSATQVAWSVHVEVAPAIAAELDALAAEEPPGLGGEPVHAARYAGFGTIGGGPQFAFPDVLPDPGETHVIDDEALLDVNFNGWIPGEIAQGRAPVIAVIEDGAPVSVCFCARLGEHAAAAGLETAAAYRQRGFAVRVTAGWARAVRASGREPGYSTSWDNLASRGVARRLGLVMDARSFTIGQ